MAIESIMASSQWFKIRILVPKVSRLDSRRTGAGLTSEPDVKSCPICSKGPDFALKAAIVTTTVPPSSNRLFVNFAGTFIADER
ncbi:hypothetical protein ES703_121499 [subsurface metagenome]